RVRPPPPSTTPFPYTTLFRSGVARLDEIAVVIPFQIRDTDVADQSVQHAEDVRVGIGVGQVEHLLEPEQRRQLGARPQDPIGMRSEEHTSELQSRENLVCRLL